MSEYNKDSLLINKIIFYVEDDIYANESTTFMLKNFFPNVQSFFDGEEVLEAIKNGILPDLILSDIQMPKTNGLELTKEIKEQGYQIPVILLTAYNDSEYLKSAIDLKIDKYITKPIIDIKNLVNEIYTLVEQYDNQKLKNILNDNSIYSRTDLLGLITNVSDGFCRLTGYSKEELIGKRHSILRFPNMPKTTYQNLWDTIQKDKIWKGELKNIRKDGSYYWIEHTISPDYDETGKKIGYMSLSNDITAKKDFEDTHLKLLQEAKHASIEELLENISHQWRQPLNLITLIAGQFEIDLEFHTLKDEEKKELLDSIIQNAQKLSDTIENFSKYISNDKKLCNIILEDEITYALELLRSSFQANKINIIDNVDYSNKTEKILVQNELSQVIINILTNSKEAHQKDESKSNKWVNISTKKDKNNYIIIIEDNAGGVNEDILDKLFEPYFTTKFKSNGVGLGLHLTQRLILESFRGEIDVENSNIGLKTIITIPLKL